MHLHDRTTAAQARLSGGTSSIGSVDLTLRHERRKTGAPAWLLGPLGLLAWLLCADAHAQTYTFRPYVEGFAAVSGVNVGDLEYFPAFGGVSAGAFLRPGIGLELHAEGELRAGDDDDFEFAYENGLGASLRLQSPPQRGISGYVLLGYARFSVRQERENGAGAGAQLSETFGGPRVSIGLVQRLERWPLLSVSAEFRKYYVEDGIDIDSFVLGLRMGRR